MTKINEKLTQLFGDGVKAFFEERYDSITAAAQDAEEGIHICIFLKRVWIMKFRSPSTYEWATQEPCGDLKFVSCKKGRLHHSQSHGPIHVFQVT